MEDLVLGDVNLLIDNIDNRPKIFFLHYDSETLYLELCSRLVFESYQHGIYRYKVNGIAYTPFLSGIEEQREIEQWINNNLDAKIGVVIDKFMGVWGEIS